MTSAPIKALQKMRELGFILTLVQNRLDVETPNGLTDEQRDFIRLHKTALVEELKAEDLAPTAQAPATDNEPLRSSPSHHWQKQVTCGDCSAFNRRADHRFLGHCAKGMPEALVGLRSDFTRYCEAFEAYTKSEPTVKTETSFLGVQTPVSTAIIKPMVCSWDWQKLVTRCDKPDIFDDENYQVVGCRHCGEKRLPS